MRLAVLLVTLVLAADPAPKPAKREWTVQGVSREALVYVPADAKSKDTPVVFAFHGHGGTARHAAAKFAYHTHWPEALVVYPQGLPTVTRNDPKGDRPGWQNAAGLNKDRDLAFVDAVLASLKKDYKVDAARVYATGHSNGGGFTYLLWAERGDTFAAFAPSASLGLRHRDKLTPKPALHVAGEKDTTAPFDRQQKSMEMVRKLNGCDDTGKAWAKHGTLYPSKAGTPFVALVYPDGHKFPDAAPELIVKFFKEHAKK